MYTCTAGRSRLPGVVSVAEINERPDLPSAVWHAFALPQRSVERNRCGLIPSFEPNDCYYHRLS